MTKKPTDWRPSIPGITGKPKRKRKSRAKYSKRLKAAIKQVRSALAVLKQKKVIPKEYNVKAAVPTPAVRRLINKNKAVATKQASTWKLPDDIPKEITAAIKKQGYKIIKDSEGHKRVVLPSTEYSRRGKVYQKPTVSRPGYEVTDEDISAEELSNGDIEKKVRRAFEKKKTDTLVGFKIFDEQGKGGTSYHLYASPEAMLADLMAYREKASPFNYTSLTTFKVTKAKQPAFAHDASIRARQRVIGSAEYRARRNQRARDRRARKAGIRASRGH